MSDLFKSFQIVAIELTDSVQDARLLEIFYQQVYVPEFPDINERESMENIRRYLQLKSQGWYGKNNYHILLLLSDGQPVAGSVIDYLVTPNSGVIEFLVVKAALRKRGLGALLLQWVEETLNIDSRNAGYTDVDFMVGEMNDPFKSDALTDSMDPFTRAKVWHHWGYQKIRFPYVQPALSKDKTSVTNLLLMCKPRPTSKQNSIPVTRLCEIIYGYIRWAMRIDDPSLNKEYRGMIGYMAEINEVELLSLLDYTADDSVRHLVYCDAIIECSEDLDGILDVYSEAFQPGLTSLDRSAFEQFIVGHQHANNTFNYHLLAIKTQSSDPPQGMASFFSFSRVGYAGYLALAKGIRGKGYLREVISVIEGYFARDNLSVKGWWIECVPEQNTAVIFAKYGFHEVNIRYCQPPLGSVPSYPVEEAPVLQLMYKPIGENFGLPIVTTNELLHALCEIYRVVYQIDRPDQNPFYNQVKKQVSACDVVPWV